MTGGRESGPGRMHAEEVDVDEDLVHRLVAAQFPDWAVLPLRRVSSTGTDNVIYRLGDAYGIRLPRIGWAVDQVAKEAEWLPRLAPNLPTALPEPVAVGEAGCGYPYPWLVYRWIDGMDALSDPVADWVDLAQQVAGFVAALQSLDTADAPPARARGGSLAAVDGATRTAIERLAGTIDAARALAVWEEALGADAWTGPPVWVHGDLLPGNVLVRDGTLAGIIDWSAAGIGDPACEAMLGWAMPRPGPGRLPPGACLRRSHLGAGPRLGPPTGGVLHPLLREDHPHGGSGRPEAIGGHPGRLRSGGGRG
jgi:aminoglycoside phosphotransferase (APT) family kinase protein